MRKYQLLSLLLCISAVFFAQEPKRFTGALLWKISGNGLAEPSYVVGTHHFISENFVDSIPGLREVMEQTVQTFGELDMSDMLGMQMKMLEAGTMPEEESYRALLSEPDYTRLDKKLMDVLGAGLDQYGQLKPGVILSVVTMVIFNQIFPEEDVMTHVGIDTYIQQVAQESEKAVGGLETVDEQIQLFFYSKPLKRQVNELCCVMDNFDISIEKAKELTANYRNADLYKLYTDSFEDSSDPCTSFMDENEHRDLLENRNNNWLAKMPALMKGNSTLFVVGALHLPGEEGLLYQLTREGYKVEPMR